MELKVTQYIIQYLLGHGYASKKALAEQFGIPYRTLIRVCGKDADRRTATRVTRSLIRGCVAQRIPIENALVI